MDAAAGEDDCADLLAVVAHLATSVVAVYCAYWSSIVASTDDLVVLYDDSSDCLLQAGCPFFQDHADVKKVLVIARAEFPYDVFVMF